MRNIYVDEAGTSTNEPVSVVAALIVNPDQHWHPVLTRMRELWDHHIPAQYRRENTHYFHTDFTFHAKDLSDGRKYPRWSEQSRTALMKAMMGLPREFEIPISFSAVKRGAIDWSSWPDKEKKRMTPTKSDHMMAFMGCIGESNRIMHDAFQGELSQVIYDHHAEMPGILKEALNRLQGQPFDVSIGMQRAESEFTTESLKADRVIDEVLFLDSRNAPFLQIVDACAYGLKRCIAGFSKGDEYFNALADSAPPKLLSSWEMFFATIDHKMTIILPPPTRILT